MWGLSIFSVFFNFANMDVKVVWIGEADVCAKENWMGKPYNASEATSYHPHQIGFFTGTFRDLQLLKCHVKKLCKVCIANKNTQASSILSSFCYCCTGMGNEVLARPWAGLEQSQSHMVCFDWSYSREIVAPGCLKWAHEGRAFKQLCWQVRSHGDFSSDNAFYVLKYFNNLWDER